MPSLPSHLDLGIALSLLPCICCQYSDKYNPLLALITSLDGGIARR